MNSLKGDFWIRLLYTHPAHWTDELIHTIAECPKVARYVDIPLQHIHENMLQRMRRETSQQYIVDLIRKIRAGVPGIALRTTFIVGFPGETEASFNALLDFIRETKFERLGVFTYSKEDGTLAGKNGRANPRQNQKTASRTGDGRAAQNRPANFRILRWPRQSKSSSKARRTTNSFSRRMFLMGTWSDYVSVKSRNSQLAIRNYLVARGEADAPDIDGRVYVRGKLPIGEFAQVKIVGHTDYDLIAERA